MRLQVNANCVRLQAAQNLYSWIAVDQTDEKVLYINTMPQSLKKSRWWWQHAKLQTNIGLTQVQLNLEIAGEEQQEI